MNIIQKVWTEKGGRLKNGHLWGVAKMQVEKQPNNLELQVAKRTKDLSKRIVELENARSAMSNLLEDFEEEQNALAEANAKSRAILTSIADGCIVVDDNGEIILINRMAQKLLGYSSKESVGKQWYEILRRKDEQGNAVSSKQGAIQAALSATVTTTSNLEERKKLVASKVRTMPGIYYYERKNKTKFPVAITVAPVILNNKIVGAVEVFRDITREKEIDKTKTEFVSLASHQLRTPLAAVNWYTEMLMSGDAGELNKKQKNYLNEIYYGNQRMVELVNALLSVSRIEMGTFMVEPEPTDIVRLVRGEIDAQKSRIDAKRLALSFSFGKNIPLILADPNLLRMVVQNLLSNAVKYTQEGGKIKLALSLMDKKNMLLKISDTGYGIPKNQQRKIFTKLFRADNVQAQDAEGTGLGLYIVKSIMEHSGGKIWFESEENKGTTFFVTVPLEGMKKKKGTKVLV